MQAIINKQMKKIPESSPQGKKEDPFVDLSDPFAVDVAQKIDLARVDAIARDFTKTDIAATRCLRLLGEGGAMKSLLEGLFHLDHTARVKLVQAVTGVGNVPAAAKISWVPDANESELRLAQVSNRIKGTKKVTSLTIFEDLTSLPPGKSGAIVTIGYSIGEDSLISEFVYGVPGGDVIAKVTVPVGPIVGETHKKMSKFFDVLREDDQRVELCAGNPSKDFFVPLFFAALNASWDASAKRMNFAQRPHAVDYRFRASGRVLSLLNVETGPFSKVLKGMRDHLSRIPCDENPIDFLGWIWSNTVLESASDIDLAKIEALRKQFMEEDALLADALEMSLAEFIAVENDILENPDHPAHFLKKQYCGVSIDAALADLMTHREYRGAERGVGQAAALNTVAKDVGVRPLALVLNSAPTVLHRYVPILEEIHRMGLKSVSVYGDYRTFPLVDYAKTRHGIDLTVYTSVVDTPFVTRDFVQDGFHPEDKSDVRIVEVFPNVPAVSGANVDVVKWGAQRIVLKKIETCNAPVVINFSRLVLRKVNDAHVLDVEPYLAATKGHFVSIDFHPCRAHNGEFVIWRTRPDVSGLPPRLEGASMESREIADFFWNAVARSVSSRIMLGNRLRTHAIPFGVLQHFRKRRVHEVAGVVVEADPVRRDLFIINARMHASIRASLAETHTKSTAVPFAAAPPKLLWGNAPKLFLKNKKPPKPEGDEAPTTQ